MTVDDYPWMPARVAEDRANEWREAESFNGDQEPAIVLAAEVRRLRKHVQDAADALGTIVPNYERAEAILEAALKGEP